MAGGGQKIMQMACRSKSTFCELRRREPSRGLIVYTLVHQSGIASVEFELVQREQVIHFGRSDDQNTFIGSMEKLILICSISQKIGFGRPKVKFGVWPTSMYPCRSAARIRESFDLGKHVQLRRHRSGPGSGCPIGKPVAARNRPH